MKEQILGIFNTSLLLMKYNTDIAEFFKIKLVKVYI